MTRVRLNLIFSGLLLLSGALGGCQKATPLKAVKVVNAHVETTISTTTTGTVDAYQQAALAFGTVGRVEQVLVKIGNQAKKGQLLAKLENRDVQSIYDNAMKEMRRSRELFKDNLVSRANLDETSKALEVADANLAKTVIKAPFDGLITELNLHLGEVAQTQFTADKVPIRIVDQKPRIIKGDIDEVDLPRVHIGSIARVKIPAVRSKPYTAVVERVIPYVSTTKEQERTARIELKIKEGDQLIPVGASAEIEVIVESKENVLAVPSRSILGAGSDRYVYRYSDGRILKTLIVQGIGNYERTEITSGLNAGDIIIIPGDVELQDKMKVKTEMMPWP